MLYSLGLFLLIALPADFSLVASIILSVFIFTTSSITQYLKIIFQVYLLLA